MSTSQRLRASSSCNVLLSDARLTFFCPIDQVDSMENTNNTSHATSLRASYGLNEIRDLTNDAEVSEENRCVFHSKLHHPYQPPSLEQIPPQAKPFPIRLSYISTRAPPKSQLAMYSSSFNNIQSLSISFSSHFPLLLLLLRHLHHPLRHELDPWPEPACLRAGGDLRH